MWGAEQEGMKSLLQQAQQVSAWSSRASLRETGAPLLPTVHTPDLRGVQLSSEQVDADEGAGQAAFAQRRLGCTQGLHTCGGGKQSWGELRAPKGSREAERGGGNGRDSGGAKVEGEQRVSPQA